MCRPASTRSRVRRMSCWLGRRVAARVVVDDDDRGRAERDRAGDHLADMDRRFVDRPLPQRLVGDQHVLGVEEQHPHLLDPRDGPSRRGDSRRAHPSSTAPAGPRSAPRAGAAPSPRRSSARRWSRRSALRGAAYRRWPTATARFRRNRGAAAWRAAWCRPAGWSARADIRPAHNRGSRPARRRAAACASRARCPPTALSLPLADTPVHAAPCDRPSKRALNHRWRGGKRSCRFWNGRRAGGLV